MMSKKKLGISNPKGFLNIYSSGSLCSMRIASKQRELRPFLNPTTPGLKFGHSYAPPASFPLELITKPVPSVVPEHARYIKYPKLENNGPSNLGLLSFKVKNNLRL